MNEYTFQYYKSEIKATKAIGFLKLDSFVKAIKEPKEDIKRIMLQIQEATNNEDNELKNKLKTQLYAFTPCVNVSNKRRLSDLTAFTVLMVLDFDKIKNAEEFRDYLYEQYDFIVASWLSPSKKGIKALVKIPKIDIIHQEKSIKHELSVNVFKSFFWGIYYEMTQYYGFDTTAQNCVLPLFMSWDKDIRYRTDAIEWDIQDIDPKLKHKPKPQNESYKYDYSNSDKPREWALKNTEKAIDRIVDEGHPQLRAAAYALGGYVGAGYLSQSEAVEFINNMIERNHYLQKGIAGYQKTALTMINDGIFSPLKFDKV